MEKPLVVHCKKDKYDVYIGRPSKWGNPYTHIRDRVTKAEFVVESREKAIEKYKTWFLAQPDLVAQAKVELRGKVLGCWCHPKKCHGDFLVEIANASI